MSLLDRLRALDAKATPPPWDTWIEGERGRWGGSPCVLGPDPNVLAIMGGGAEISAEDARLVVELRNSFSTFVALAEAAQNVVVLEYDPGATNEQNNAYYERAQKFRAALVPFVAGEETIGSSGRTLAQELGRDGAG